MNPTPEQVATQVAALLRHRPDARIVGIHSAGGWTGGESLVVNDSRWFVRVCRSALEMSERLSAMGDDNGLIILTPLPDQALSLDVLARLAGRRLMHIERWAMVREAFGATRIDPRLPRQGWLADALLGAMPAGGFSPVPSGWLDMDTAWLTLSEQETLLAGPRIRAATGMDRVVLLWSEAARYCQKKNGYHGGATPQEVVVPLGVFLGMGQALDGWQPLPEYVPEWWLTSAPVRAPRFTRQDADKAPPPGKGQGSLFETLERAAEAPASAWIRQLIDSEVFAAQQRLAGRRAPPVTTVREVLITLEARRGHMPRRILARVIQVPEFRLRGILTGLQRLLNVDGYQVLSVEEETETVLLDMALLKRQFQLGN